jgi:hypothetical protein
MDLRGKASANGSDYLDDLETENLFSDLDDIFDDDDADAADDVSFDSDASLTSLVEQDDNPVEETQPPVSVGSELCLSSAPVSPSTHRIRRRRSSALVEGVDTGVSPPSWQSEAADKGPRQEMVLNM